MPFRSVFGLSPEGNFSFSPRHPYLGQFHPGHNNDLRRRSTTTLVRSVQLNCFNQQFVNGALHGLYGHSGDQN